MNRETKNITKRDTAFLLKLISNRKKFDLFPLSENGRLIFEMAWGEQKSFEEIANNLSLSNERVRQLYCIELRRFTYFIDKAFKEFKTIHDLKAENETLKALTSELKGAIEELKNKSIRKAS